jgi:alpha-L-fucosidase
MKTFTKTTTILAFIVALTACGDNKKTYGHIPETHPQMERLSIIPNVGAETAPIIFNGVKYLISFTGREGIAGGGGFIVFDWQGNIVTKISAPRMATGSAIVVDGVVYVFASTGVTLQGTLTLGNQILMSKSADLFNWSAPVVAYQLPANVGSGNTSVTQTPEGFVMAYDFDNPRYFKYSYRFLFSTDLVNWSPIGGTFRAHQYTSCPSIRWVNGEYYLFFLDMAAIPGYTAYFTKLARSKDLSSFEEQTSPYSVISPGLGEGTAVTDLDLIEENGQTFFIYSAGDQLTWGEEHLARYNGTLIDFVKLFF